MRRGRGWLKSVAKEKKIKHEGSFIETNHPGPSLTKEGNKKG
jgi:hypothetical protein